MQADWEVEIGGDAPVIEAGWPGFVDLRKEPLRAHKLPESAALPGIAEVLIRLNAAASPVRTSKCDLWPIESLPGIGFDGFDLDAGVDDTASALGCYIDLLPRSDQQWPSPARIEQTAKDACARLQAATLTCCRIDLVARQAHIAPGLNDFGITAYITACGRDIGAAQASLAAALRALADAMMPVAEPTRS
jgi:hypothetical protein